LRSLQEIHPDFEEEAKVYAGLWSQGKKKKKKIRRMSYWQYVMELNLALPSFLDTFEVTCM
jgi:hypothetical protein